MFKRHLPLKIMKAITITVVLILLASLQGCKFYYNVQTVKPVEANSIRQYDSLNKYFILHQGDSAWHLSQVNIADNMLSGVVSVLPFTHVKYKTTKPKGGTRYKNTRQNSESCVLEEVHLYLMDSVFSTIKTGDSINLDYSVFTKADVYLKDKGKTTASWLIPAFSVMGVVVGWVIFIIAMN
jgi:hypothetical protein